MSYRFLTFCAHILSRSQIRTSSLCGPTEKRISIFSLNTPYICNYNQISRRLSAYKIKVTTGDKKGAGTDANVYIRLYNSTQEKSSEHQLDKFFKDDFERNQTDEYTIKDVDVGDIAEIEVWRDNAGLFSDWYLQLIEITSVKSGKTFSFPINRWINPDSHYFFHLYDAALPQDDRHESRRLELEKIKEQYKLQEKVPGCPSQVETVPKDEEFSFSYEYCTIKAKGLLLQKIEKQVLLLFQGDKWESLESLKNVYTLSFGEPAGMRRWDDDKFFSWQRLNSLNSSLISLCSDFPTKIGVTDEMLRPLLERHSIEEALRSKRLFYIDLEILDGIPCKENLIVPAPIALFYLNSQDQLVPVAIQLFQQKGEGNPVFLPTDPPCTWLMAKMWYNMAEAHVHQAATHLGFTHMIMEGISVSMNRNISPSHPVFKLLKPHFHFLIAINALALQQLISEDGLTGKRFSAGREGAFEIIRRRMKIWRLDVDGNLPKDLKKRGVYKSDKEDVLPGYYFRDDAMLLYNAIYDYVTKYINLYYDAPEKIIGDWEIQNFGKELITPQDQGGCGILGIPFEGKFDSQEQLITLFTSIIYISSVVHAAVNFPQYDEYAFPANYPTTLQGVPPTDKTPLTDEDILKSLADKGTVLDTMALSMVLSQRATNKLGDFEQQYIFDPRGIEIVEEFRSELKRISAAIRERNKYIHPKYEYLDPELIPNSISI